MMRSFSELGQARIECPFCHDVREHTIILSYQPAFHDSDLLPHAEGYDDLLLSVHECPACGGCFVQDRAFQEELSRTTTSAELIIEIRQLVARHEFPDIYVERFLFCAYFMEIHASSPFSKAHFWHQAAWAARVRLNDELERFCLERALAHYKECYKEPRQDLDELAPTRAGELYPEFDEYVPFIIGEISRRLERFEDAEKYFDMINEPTLGLLARKLATLARSKESSNMILEAVT